jgi:hypothetical protein
MHGTNIFYYNLPNISILNFKGENMINLRKVLFMLSLITTIVSAVIFPLGIYILLSTKMYTYLFPFILYYVVLFILTKIEISKIDTIELKFGK